MLRDRKRTSQAEEYGPYLESVVNNLVDKIYGPQGPHWGTEFTELEDLFLDLGEVLTKQILQVTLRRHAAHAEKWPESHRICPSCQRPVPCPTEDVTWTGKSEWTEQDDYCHTCREIFIPQVQGSGV